MEQLPGGRRPRLVSSLGLGQRSCEVTLDEERGGIAWRDPRPPRRGSGEWSGGRAGRSGAGRRERTCRGLAVGRGRLRGRLSSAAEEGRSQRPLRRGAGRPRAGMLAGAACSRPCARRVSRRRAALGSERAERSEPAVGAEYFPYSGAFSPYEGSAAASGVQSPRVEGGGRFSHTQVRAVRERRVPGAGQMEPGPKLCRDGHGQTAAVLNHQPVNRLVRLETKLKAVHRAAHTACEGSKLSVPRRRQLEHLL